MSHVVIYIPGLGDGSVKARRFLVAGWRLYGVQPVVHRMNWADKEPFSIKFQRLLLRIDGLVKDGHTVSLVGESAGASAALNAYAARQNEIHRVVCLCGKLQHAETVHPYTNRRNPAFAQSMAMLPVSVKSLSKQRLGRVRSIRPWADHTVSPSDTFVAGAESYTIPTIGHRASIILGNTLFSNVVVGFLKRD